eukprot:sb/3470819/
MNWIRFHSADKRPGDQSFFPQPILPSSSPNRKFPRFTSLTFPIISGVQIHVQMDYILKWSHQLQLSHSAVNQFKDLNQLLDILSLPKRDLLSSEWTALARAFPVLSAQQLNHVLSNYSVISKPLIWKPSPPLSFVPESSSSIRLQLTSYPALTIPQRGYRIATSSDLPDLIRGNLSKLSSLISSSSTSSSTTSRDK